MGKISSFTFCERCFVSWQGISLVFCRVFKRLLILSFEGEVCPRTITDNNKEKSISKHHILTVNFTLLMNVLYTTFLNRFSSDWVFFGFEYPSEISGMGALTHGGHFLKYLCPCVNQCY